MKKRYKTGVFLLLLFVLVSGTYVSAQAAEITFNMASVALAAGQSTTVKVSVSGASAKKCTWSSSNKKIATVSKKTGKVKAKRAGKCKVTCTLKNGESASIPVRVYKNGRQFVSKTSLTLIGHRGDRSKYADNTIEGIKSTLKLGWDGAECDVYYTQSGDFLVCHDDNLNRMCGVDKSIYTVTAESRFQYPLKKNGKIVSDSYMPTIEEVIRAMASKKGMLVIHCYGLNNTGISRIAAIVKMYQMTEHVIFYGKEIEQMQKLARMGFTTGYIYLSTDISEAKELVDKCSAAGLTWFISYLSRGLDKELVDHVHEKGMKIGQGKVTTKAQLYRLESIGADMAMLDSRLAVK